jgi:hypothetical protein
LINVIRPENIAIVAALIGLSPDPGFTPQVVPYTVCVEVEIYHMDAGIRGRIEYH